MSSWDSQGLWTSEEGRSWRPAPGAENLRGGQQLWVGRLGLVPAWGLRSALCHPHLARNAASWHLDGGPLWPHVGPGPQACPVHPGACRCRLMGAAPPRPSLQSLWAGSW